MHLFDKLIILAKNNKFVLSLVLIIIIGLITINLFLGSSKVPETDNNVSPTPTDIHYTDEFKVVNISPPSGEQEIMSPIKSIQIIFTNPINEDTVTINSQPHIELEYFTERNGLSLHVKPIERWELKKEYNITINVKSLEGESLPNPIHYRFYATFPSVIQEIE